MFTTADVQIDFLLQHCIQWGHTVPSRVAHEVAYLSHLVLETSIGRYVQCHALLLQVPCGTVRCGVFENSFQESEATRLDDRVLKEHMLANV